LKTENKKRKPLNIDHNFISLQNQTVTEKKLSIFSDLFPEFKIGSLLNRSGISKTKGATPLALPNKSFTLFEMINELFAYTVVISSGDFSP